MSRKIIHTTVNIYQDQKEWIDATFFKLSPFIRKRLDEKIKEGEQI